MAVEKWDISEFGWSGIMGVYAVCVWDKERDKNYVLYVGSSQDIGKRLANLKHPYRILFDALRYPYIVYIKFKPTKDYRDIEKKFIKKLKPIMNVK